jgi:predicted DNA-binding transcriptional regulator YafY
MKADRLVSILLLLQSARRRTALELARAMEVSTRTIYRDVDALSAAGVPIHAERGHAGGIVLAEGYRSALVQLGEDEIRALFVSGTAILADLGLDTNLNRALEKLRGGLSEGQRRVARLTGERIHIDQRRWNQDDPPLEKLALLRRAIWDDRRVELDYEDRNGAATTRIAEPLGLVSKAGVWYVVAGTAQGLRSFRVDRIRELRERDETFARPPDFDLDAYWRESATNVDRRQDSYTATLQVARELVAAVSSYWSYEVLADGDPALIAIRFPSPQIALGTVLSWGPGVEVVAPPELRAGLAERARELLARYGPIRESDTSCHI